jgi:hypothetical protein
LPAVCEQPVVATEGQPDTQVVGNFTTTDVNPQASQFAASVDWGDGTSSPLTIVANPVGSFNLIGTHTFAEEGCCEEVNLTTVNVLDLSNSNGTVSIASARDVTDAPLTATWPAISPAAGTAFQGTVATFTDADPGGTASDYTATIDWGDGSPPDQGTVTADGSGFDLSGSHTYAACGTSTITVQISDAGGAVATATGTATRAC